MKTTDKNKLALALLDKYLANNSKEAVQALIDKNAKKYPNGITYYEYLDGVQNYLTGSTIVGGLIQIRDCETIGVLRSDDGKYYIPPPSINDNSEKKDLVSDTRSFFLLYLHHDRRKKRCFQVR